MSHVMLAEARTLGGRCWGPPAAHTFPRTGQAGKHGPGRISVQYDRRCRQRLEPQSCFGCSGRVKNLELLLPQSCSNVRADELETDTGGVAAQQ